MKFPGLHAIGATVARDFARGGAGLAVLFALWHVPIGLAHVTMSAAIGNDPMAATFVNTLIQAVLYVPILSGVAFVAAGAAGTAGLAPAARVGARRWFALFPAWLVYCNRLGVGLVLGVLPGVVWLVQGRFLAQAATLRPDVPPFEHSRAVVAGAWWPLLGLSCLSGVTQFVPLLWGGLALGALSRDVPTAYAHAAGAAFAAALLACFWCVVDTRLFLYLERRNGLAPPYST